jgi:hypothetical protein
LDKFASPMPADFKIVVVVVIVIEYSHDYDNDKTVQKSRRFSSLSGRSEIGAESRRGMWFCPADGSRDFITLPLSVFGCKCRPSRVADPVADRGR